MYELVRDADGPLTRDDVATATGSTRTAVGFHLDALVEAGLLSVDYAKPAGLPELIDVLRTLGYRPLQSPDRDAVRLRDCPFHAVSREAPELVCPANLLYLQGVLDGLGAAEGIHAVLDEAGAGCCVSLV